MSDYGMKVTKVGKSVSSTDIRDWILHSDYSMFKYHETLSGTLNVSVGSQTGSLELNHTLNYVPAFLVYVNGKLMPPTIYAYATTTKVHIDLDLGYIQGLDTYTPQSSYDYWANFFNTSGYILVGTKDGNSRSGAVRVPSVNLSNSESIVSATLDCAVEYKGSGSGDLAIKTYGIDEDNTNNFSSDPMGRSQTTAVTTQTVALPSTGSRFGINVKSQIEEIISRAGWSSGNAMGFHVTNNGSPADVWAEDDYGTGINFELKITHGSNYSANVKVIIFKDKISS